MLYRQERNDGYNISVTRAKRAADKRQTMKNSQNDFIKRKITKPNHALT